MKQLYYRATATVKTDQGREWQELVFINNNLNDARDHAQKVINHFYPLLTLQNVERLDSYTGKQKIKMREWHTFKVD